MLSDQAALTAIGRKALQAQTLLARALSSRVFSDVEPAVAAWHHLVSITDSAYPHREAILSTFAVALLLRWETYHDLSDLDLAIEHAEAALQMCHHSPNRDRYQNLANLGGAYLDRAKSAKEGPDRAIEDAKWAYSYLEKAYHVYMRRGKELNLRWEIMISLARAHKYLYEHRASGSQSLERIVHLMTEALPLTPPTSSGPALFLLGDANRFLYLRRNASHFLHEALARLSAALEPGRNMPAEDRLDAQIALGVCCFEAYSRYRRMEDLDRAVETFKSASEESGHCTTYANVANVLYHKYKETGDSDALNEAIEFYGVELAVTENPETKRGMGRRYSAYGKALTARFGLKHDIEDLERAVEFFERAVRRAGRDDLREWATTLERARGRLEKTREELKREETPSPPQVQPPLPPPQLQTQMHFTAERLVESPEPVTPTTPTTFNPFNSMSATLATASTRAGTAPISVTNDGPVDTTPKPRPRVLKKPSSILSSSIGKSGRSKTSKVPTLGTLPQKQPIDMSALNRALSVIGVHSKWTRSR